MLCVYVAYVTVTRWMLYFYFQGLIKSVRSEKKWQFKPRKTSLQINHGLTPVVYKRGSTGPCVAPVWPLWFKEEKEGVVASLAINRLRICNSITLLPMTIRPLQLHEH